MPSTQISRMRTPQVKVGSVHFSYINAWILHFQIHCWIFHHGGFSFWISDLSDEKSDQENFQDSIDITDANSGGSHNGFWFCLTQSPPPFLLQFRLDLILGAYYEERSSLMKWLDQVRGLMYLFGNSLIPDYYLCWSDGMRCCRATGLGIVCFVAVNPRVVSQQS